MVGPIPNVAEYIICIHKMEHMQGPFNRFFFNFQISGLVGVWSLSHHIENPYCVKRVHMITSQPSSWPFQPHGCSPNAHTWPTCFHACGPGVWLTQRGSCRP